jgi:hypothetical protein
LSHPHGVENAFEACFTFTVHFYLKLKLLNPCGYFAYFPKDLQITLLSLSLLFTATTDLFPVTAPCEFVRYRFRFVGFLNIYTCACVYPANNFSVIRNRVIPAFVVVSNLCALASGFDTGISNMVKSIFESIASAQAFFKQTPKETAFPPL